MFKLLFSTAMIAPVLVFALQGEMSGGELIENGASITQYASAEFTSLTATECRSETVAVVFHGDLIETHSAHALGEALQPREGCEASFVRLTSLVPEDADMDELDAANRRRAELAAHIEALVDDAGSLPMHSEFQSSAASQPIHHHALLRVERRPVDASVPAFASTATSTATLN